MHQAFKRSQNDLLGGEWAGERAGGEAGRAAGRPLGEQERENPGSHPAPHLRLCPSVCQLLTALPHHPSLLVVVLSPPLAWPLCPAPGPLSQDSQVKLCPGLASELLSAHPPLHPHSCSPALRSRGQTAGTPEVKGGPGHCPGSRGQRGSEQDRPRQLGSPCQQEWSPVGRLLPEAHTRPSVIKAISHLPTGEPQARAATAGSAWGFVLGRRVGTSRQRWVGLESKDCPPFWLPLRWCWGSEALLRGSARSFATNKGLASSLPWMLRVSSLQNTPKDAHCLQWDSLLPFQKYLFTEHGVGVP